MIFSKGEKPGGFIGRGQTSKPLRADRQSASLRLGERVAYTKSVDWGRDSRKMKGHVEIQRLCKRAGQGHDYIARRYFDPPIIAADMASQAKFGSIR